MAGERTVLTFADAPLEIIDGDRGSNYPKQSDFHATGYCLFLNAGNVTSRGFDFSHCAFIAAEKDAALRKGKLVRGDVVLTTRGTVGNAAYFDDSIPFENIRINSGMVILRAKTSALMPRYLYLFVRSLLFYEQIRALRTGSAQPQLPIRDINRIEIPIPRLEEQRAIAHILGTLDDKIELNHRINETLEAIAQAIFKSWFVHFDPVRAKVEGRDAELPKHIANLFPDRFEDSELGPIPEGWKAGQMQEILHELVSGSRPKGGAITEGVPSIGAENVLGLGLYDFSKEKYIPQDLYEQLNMKGAVIRPGDVLLYKDGAQIGRKTYFDCSFPHATSAINEHVFILRAKRAWFQRFLFFWLDQRWMTEEIISLNSNSAQPGINQRGVRSLPILIPDTRAVKEFDALIRPFIQRLFQNCLESRSLASLRGALLPKLISGELQLRDAEKFLEYT